MPALIVILILLSGCVGARIQHNDFGNVLYWRVGGQELNDIRLQVNSNTVFYIGRQYADGKEVGEVSGKIVEGIIEGIK